MSRSPRKPSLHKKTIILKLGSQCKEKDIKSEGLKDQYSPATMLAAGKFKNYIKTIKKSENGKIEVRFFY